MEAVFLVDMGAPLSLLSFIPKESVSQGKVSIQGVMGKGDHVLSKLLTIGNKMVCGRSVIQ